MKNKSPKEMASSNEPRPVGRPRKHKRDRPAAEQGAKEGEARASFIVRKDQIEALRDIAYWERLKIKDVVIGALDDRIEKYKRKNGEIEPRPKP